MKMTPAFLLLIASALSSQAALASNVTVEYWTCKGDGTGNVKSFTATVDQQGRSSNGGVTDPGIRATPIDVLGSSEGLYTLSGGYFGHDSVEYTVQLSPESTDWSSSSTSLQAKGSATISYTGFIDCVGEVSRVEKLSCEVQFERE